MQHLGFSLYRDKGGVFARVHGMVHDQELCTLCIIHLGTLMS